MQTNTKEWIQYGTASLMVVSGVVLTFISFFMTGDVTDGVLWYMAQALTYAGAVFGVSVYFRQKIGESKNEIRNYFNKKLDEENSYENNHIEEIKP